MGRLVAGCTGYRTASSFRELHLAARYTYAPIRICQGLPGLLMRLKHGSVDGRMNSIDVGRMLVTLALLTWFPWAQSKGCLDLLPCSAYE